MLVINWYFKLERARIKSNKITIPATNAESVWSEVFSHLSLYAETDKEAARERK